APFAHAHAPYCLIAQLPRYTHRLRAVISVDADIFSAEVTRPHRGGVGAAGAEVDGDIHRVLLEVGSSVAGPLVMGHAIHEQMDGPDRHRRAVEHERRAGSAGRRDPAAPVGIAAV